MDSKAKIRFLLQPDSLQLLKLLMGDSRDDLALAQSPLLRHRPVGERSALLEQRALRLKAGSKQGLAKEMVLTPLGLMQMTAEILGKAKSIRFESRGISSLGDLCCGLGGDSMHMGRNIHVIGVERDAATLLAYRHNVSLVRASSAVLGDVNALPIQTEACIIDPARRPKGSDQNWGSSELKPSLEELLAIRKHQPNLAIKLGPGLQIPDAFADAEWEYLGWNDACLELMIWCHDLGSREMVRATEWPSGASIQASRQDRDESFQVFAGDCEEQPGRFFYEPVKCVVRAHLHALLAHQFKLKMFDTRIAYLTGDTCIDSPLLKRYSVIRELPNDLAEIKAWFKREDIGEVTIKKRGVPIIPEKVRAEVRRPGGKQSATLVFTRIGERRRVFWVKPERAVDSLSDGEGSLADDE